MRGYHRLAYGLVVFSLGLAAILALVIVACSLTIARFVPGEPAPPITWQYAAWALVPVVFAASGWALAVRLRWRWLALAAIPVAAAFAFLAYDDSAPPPLPDLGPRVGMDDTGYQTLMWFAEKSPHCRLHEPGAPNATVIDLRLSEDSAKWGEHIAAHRSAIFQAAEANTIGRDWIAALDQRPPAGIWPLVRLDVYLDFKSVRATVEMQLAQAYALALNGDRDEAIRTVLPPVRAMHNLQRTSTTLLNVGIANVLLKRCYRVIDAILQTGPVADGTRLLLTQTLAAAPPIRQVFRNAFLGEGDFVRLVFESLRSKNLQGVPLGSMDRWVGIGLQIGGPLIFAPNQTERQINAVFLQECSVAEARDFYALENWLPDWGSSSQLKNPVGRLLAAMIIPAFQKLVKEIWMADDMRLALQTKCEANQLPASSDGAIGATR